MNRSESCFEGQEQAAFWVVAYARMAAAVGLLYCRAFHRTISRPVKGKYRCWRCLREFEIQW